MPVSTGAVRESTRVISLDGKRYNLLTRRQGKALGVARTWHSQRVSVQDIDLQEIAIPMRTFHDGSGFTYAGLGTTYDYADGWAPDSPGKIRTWARLATAAATTGGNYRGWLFFDPAGYLYMLRGRYVSKYAVNFSISSWAKFVADKDLGATNVVAGRPAFWQGKLYIPVKNTSNVLQVWQQLTLGGAGADTYTAGPATYEARAFTNWMGKPDGSTGELLVLANANTVRTCSTTPTTGANWSAAYQVSNSDNTITDLGVWDTYLMVRNQDGLYSFNENLRARNELPDLASNRDADAAGMAYSNGWMIVPHKAGLVQWRPQHWRLTGPEQEHALDGDLSRGWGKAKHIQPYGSGFFATMNDNQATPQGAVLWFAPPSGQRGPMRPMCLHLSGAGFDTFEGMCVVEDPATGKPGLAVIATSTTGTIGTPYIYPIPRAGLSAADDPDVVHATAGPATFYSSRMFEVHPPSFSARQFDPGRLVQKTGRVHEFWLDITPTSNTSGVQVWAVCDNGTAFQLLDSAGAVATFFTSGFKQAFFPKTASAVFHHFQIQYRVPTKTGGQVAVDVTIREGVTRVIVQPVTTDVVTCAVVLDDLGEYGDGQDERRTADTKANDLLALPGPTAAAVSYRGPNGETGYVQVRSLTIDEAQWEEKDRNVRIAHLTLEVNRYA